MWIGKYAVTRVAPAVLLGVCLLAAGNASAQSAQGLVYSRSPDTAVVEFTESLPELRGVGAGRVVRVFGDGRVDVERSPYLSRPGRHTGRLTPAELDDLVESLVDRGVLEYAPEAPPVRAPRRGDVLPEETSDATVIELVVRAARVGPAAAPAAAVPEAKRLRLRDVAARARAHPDDTALRDVAEACAVLRDLSDSDALVPTP